MKIAKLAFGLICLAIFASNIVTMSRWSEARGVYDDICYLRQAHLFQRFGIDGLNTDVVRDDDRYFVGRMQDIAFAEWQDPLRWPCHNPMRTGKIVLQYPPGTGFLLALFPQDHQVVPLYVAAGLVVCALALLAIAIAPTLPATLGAGLFGALSVYLMINPAKASYSVAPTMAVCAAAGWLTAVWAVRGARNLALIALIGLLIGASVNFRLPNLLLAGGYLIFLGIHFLRSPGTASFVQGLGFGGGLLLGMMPTLIAQAINAGSPFATTYGSVDAVAPAFDLAVLGQYFRDMQFVLIVLAIGSVGWLILLGRGAAHQAALVVSANLTVNLLFFLSHPIFTPYYVVPIAMLSLWTVTFAWLMQQEAAGDPALRRSAQPHPEIVPQ